MKFEIKSWVDAKVLFSIETESFKLAIEAAVKSRANLSEADLSWADLSWANLSRANLSEADLYGANLSRANLSRADLSRANLSRANLSWADLSRANLYGANLYGANLYGANLSRANLYGEKLTKNHIQILGLQWEVLITTQQIKIGCELHKAEEWAKFKDARISLMDSDALKFWKEHKEAILGLHKIHSQESK